MKAFYNEIEPYAAQWLRNLMGANLIMKGEIDERSIKELRPGDAIWHKRAHFFAGIGGWELALQLAGWSEDREVWTGSCPCQPFSQAGKGKGVEDERHLWPVFYRLIEECRPATIFGEQVASKAGRAWLAGVRSDLEALGYAVGTADLCAAGVGAPHIRQRLWWVAYANRNGHSGAQTHETEQSRNGADNGLFIGAGCGSIGRGNSFESRLEGLLGHEQGGHEPGRFGSEEDGSIASTGWWSDYEWVYCLDGKARRIEPGIAPLAPSVSSRVELLRPRGWGTEEISQEETESHWYSRVGAIRAYGNSIVPALAAEFIRAFMEVADIK